MKVLVAPDKFKDSLPAAAICDAVSEAIWEINPSIEVTKIPLADGGEGTFDLLLVHSQGSIQKIAVLDPLLRSIEADYGISRDGTTAFIEMAQASGLQLLREYERNPLYTSSIGTGQMIVDAMNRGVTHMIIGIGGSATNDVGIGLAHALGYRFCNQHDEELPPIGQSLSHIAFIDDSNVDQRLKQISFTVLCDVDNPLYGIQGAAHVYGPQKGATEAIVRELDAGLRHFAELVEKQYGLSLNFPGSGAAGGVGAGAKLFLKANFKRGIEYVSELYDLEDKIRSADMVITGEGKVDQQTLSGKVVSHVFSLALQHQKPVVILCGQCTLSEEELKKFGTSKIIALAGDPTEVERAITQPIPLIKSHIKRLFLNQT